MKQQTKWVAGALIMTMILLASVTVAATPTAGDQTTLTKIEGVVKDLETGKVLKRLDGALPFGRPYLSYSSR